MICVLSDIYITRKQKCRIQSTTVGSESGAGVLTCWNLLRVPLLAADKSDRIPGVQQKARTVSGSPAHWLPSSPAMRPCCWGTDEEGVQLAPLTAPLLGK